MNSPHDLERDALHLGAPASAIPIPNFIHDYEAYMREHCTAADPGRLISAGTSTESWPSWEVHPVGDEVVIVIAGTVEFLQDFNGEIRRTVVGPRQWIINPPGIPHTANVKEPFTAIYITPCPQTQHLPRTDAHV